MAEKNRLPFLKEAAQLFDPATAKLAQRQVVTKLKNKLKTKISRSIRSRYNVTNQKISKDLNMKIRDSGGIRSAFLTYIGKRISAINFSAKFKTVRTVGKKGHLKGKNIRRRGVTNRIKKGSSPSLIPGGFIAQGASGNVQVFQRIDKDDSKSKLRKATGPAIEQMVDDPETLRHFETYIDREFPAMYESQINFLLKKQAIKK